MYSMAETPRFGIAVPFTLMTLTVCAAGLPVTGGAVNETLVGFEPNVTADPIVKVTARFFAATPATLDVTGTDALNVPVASVPVVARSVSGAGSVVLPSNAAVSQPVGWPAV